MADEVLVSFTVPGLPKPKGNMRAVPIRKRDGTRGLRVTEAQGVGEWIATIRKVAADAWGKREPHHGPVGVVMQFRFPRPKSHYRGGKPESGKLRPSAAQFMTKRPDVDKLQRAVFDALAGIVIGDDSLVVVSLANKTYTAKPPGVTVAIVDMEKAMAEQPPTQQNAT
jgi:Endodeoxyribonuclease RusA.